MVRIGRGRNRYLGLEVIGGGWRVVGRRNEGSFIERGLSSFRESIVVLDK